MAMVELFRQPFFAAWFRAIDMFPRGPRQPGPPEPSASHTLDRLRAGHAVGMFPEGGIRDGARSVLEGAPLRPGVAGLAQMTAAPVIPCVIMGSDRCYGLPRLWRPGRRIPGLDRLREAASRARRPDRPAARAALEAASPMPSALLAAEMRSIFT